MRIYCHWIDKFPPSHKCVSHLWQNENGEENHLIHLKHKNFEETKVVGGKFPPPLESRLRWFLRQQVEKELPLKEEKDTVPCSKKKRKDPRMRFVVA